MITCQCAEAMPTYAPQSSYLTPIPSANIERGVAPLDSLPADWWNWLWNNITLNEGRIVQFINSVFSEINSVLSAAGVTPSTASTTDLRDAIQKLASTVATSAVPGSVLSSTLSGKLRVIADGTASINGLGTPDQLETTSKEVVSAINEVLALAQGKAPTSHASTDVTYGVGTTQQYGHVKVTEGCGLAISCGTISLNAPGYNCVGTVTQICYNGAAYSPSDGVVDLGNSPSGFPGYGTAICPLNGDLCCASSAGTSNLVARADHVHQMPNTLCGGYENYIKVGSSSVCVCTDTVCLGRSDSARLTLNGQGRRAESVGGVRIASDFSGVDAKYDMYFIPNCSMTFCQLRCTIIASDAVGVGFCVSGHYMTGVVEGIQWSGDSMIIAAYRPGAPSCVICNITLTGSQVTSDAYRMRGVLIAFR